MLRRLSKFADMDHPGISFTRLALDIFELNGPFGRHFGITSKPKGNSVRVLQEVLPYARIPEPMVKTMVHRVFFALNWLHAGCGVVHTDISPQNILMEPDDDSSFKQIEEQEAQNPSQPITTYSGEIPATVYRTRSAPLEYSGIPVLTDFGQMRVVEGNVNQDWCMSDLYRAPEVLLKLPWGYPVDIWAVGVMTLELLEGKNLFDPVDPVHNQYVLPLALAQYIAYLGPPPRDIIRQSPLFSTYFDEEAEPPIPKTSLEEFVTAIPPGEKKDRFLRFIRKLLTWDQKAREPANGIVYDDWFLISDDEMV
ncbi:hypothetical protein PRK78_005854 [Emydomyces testavorans]|uniref:EKC/KEOPS complex subunit BUD32 n=1 Tax=Emydomyces testavorans TaxID=2070801 RepID=A0AAF0DKD3_9EURO|nr:hypothetical protein PRK78_005854 [Emydomyces testavorans]